MRVPIKLIGFVVWLFSFNCGQCQVCHQADLKNYENTEPVSKSAFSDGESVRLKCEIGFTGLYKLKCEKGQWKALIKRPCAKKKCSHPGDAPNGDFKLVDGTEYVFGATVVYRCIKGFEMTSRLNWRTCRDAGWDNAVPVCEAVRCPAIHTDGEMTASGNTEEGRYGDIIHFKCLSPEKRIVGSVDIRCTEMGEWSHSVPRCEVIKCHQEYLKKYENTEPVLKSTFTDREYVRLKCLIGFTGLYILKCEKGEWKALTERPCAKKKCSHPGDAPNGDFRLLDGTEYVFGATVEYRCKKGFEMTSRLNRRTCRNAGWDNAVPVCEAVRCPAIHTDWEMTASGNTEEGRYGDIIHFECLSPEKRIKGREDIHCTDTGDWSHSVPTCEEIKCHQADLEKYENTEPVSKSTFIDGEIVRLKCQIGFTGLYKFKCEKGEWKASIERPCAKKKCSHPGDALNGDFRLLDGTEYVFGATVEYSCMKGFEMTSRINQRTCRDGGWDNAVPVCEEVTCHLESTISGLKRINPEGKTTFKVGESVELTCTEKDFFSTKETSKSFTCQRDGEWDSKPVCEIKCEVPHDQHVTAPAFYFSGDLKLGVIRLYNCESGYRKMAEEARCTRDGWTPNPLCTETMCNSPNIPNAEIVSGQRQSYTISSRIRYRCLSGFEPEEPVEITCDSQGEWTGLRQCTDGTCQGQELKNVKIIFGHPGTTLPYKPGHALFFQCTDDNMMLYGHRAIECQSDGRWSFPFPQCGGTVQCSQPTKNLQFVTVSDEKTVYSSSEILRYSCNKPYNETAGGVLMCKDGKWNGTFDCKSKTCPPPPYLEHGDFSISSSTDDKVITAVSYTCQSYYLLNKQQESYKCVKGIWETPPKCLKPCVIDDIVEKYNLKPPPENIYLMHGNKYKLDCRDGWKTGNQMKAHVDVTCSDGNLQVSQSCNTQNK